MKNKIKNIIFCLLSFLAAFVIVGSIYYFKEYPKQDFDVILFTLTAGVENTSSDVIHGIISSCIGFLIVLWLLITLLAIKNTKYRICLNMKLKNKKNKQIQLFPVKLTSNHRIIYSIFIFILATAICVKCFGIDTYVKNQLQNSSIYEDYYVDARKVKIEFPEVKRNLILIIGESFENTVLSTENGGAWEYSLMPELEKLALNNTNFSNSDTIGGSIQTYGSSYSAAGNVALTSGTPLKTSEFTTSSNLYEGSDNYLAGSYTLGEVLKDHDYNLEIIMGSDGTFGNRKQYYECNGGYKVFDVNYAIEHGKMTDEERVWWGFEDDKLYEWSKEEISELAQQDNPFNFIMLTADTHFTDGYLSQHAEKNYESQYENVHAYSSKCVNEFVEWVQAQDFANNTTIVIVGDHLGMQKAFYEEKIDGAYTRTIYNVIINPAIEAKNNKNRTYTPMDMYPTMLASIGVKIEGDRLGLGTNLYSDTQTLAEQLGYDYFNSELCKNSAYYNKYIVGDEYYKMKIEKTEEEEKKKNEEKENKSK